jgi:hypothetical protein
MRLLFDDPEVYGTQGAQLADALSERFGLPVVNADVKPPALGVGVIDTSGGMSRVAIRPDMGDSGQQILLPYHAGHFDRLLPSQEHVLSAILSRTFGASY